MNVKVLENENEILKLEFEDETETITNVLATQVWNEGGEAAAVREHPFIEKPKLVVKGKNPEKLLLKSTKALQEQCEEFSEEFKRALSK
ncbi:MAG: DNA-directed RNA polymerase subunit L [Candidatus Aenigmarchaeota archaeon]|nr:DNA-directed RNA polymerase subunit L [Candidatus Aenigmarchaeota archaeon]